MRIDITMVELADTICMLPCWRWSAGAQVERDHAKAAGTRIILYAGIDTERPRW